MYQCYDMPPLSFDQRRYFFLPAILLSFFLSFSLYDTKVIKHDTEDHM